MDLLARPIILNLQIAYEDQLKIHSLIIVCFVAVGRLGGEGREHTQLGIFVDLYLPICCLYEKNKD